MLRDPPGVGEFGCHAAFRSARSAPLVSTSIWYARPSGTRSPHAETACFVIPKALAIAPLEP